MSWLLLIAIPLLITYVWGAKLGAPWVPSRKHDLKRIFNLVRVRPGEKFYELGSGDGRVISEAVKHGFAGVGFELSLIPYALAQIRRLNNKDRRRFSIHYKNFWKVPLQEADVVYFFLLPDIYPRLAEKLRRELKPGARVIAYVWPLPEWEPAVVDKTPGWPDLYLYIQK